jgi:hypothetical protein
MHAAKPSIGPNSRRIPIVAWWWTQSRQTGLHVENSLLTGKRTGNLSFLAHFLENRSQKLALFQWLAEKFPKNQNRELIQECRERILLDQQGQGTNGGHLVAVEICKSDPLVADEQRRLSHEKTRVYLDGVGDSGRKELNRRISTRPRDWYSVVRRVHELQP